MLNNSVNSSFNQDDSLFWKAIIPIDTFSNSTLKVNKYESRNNLLFILVPIVLIIIILLFIGLVIYILRKRRLDRLRHHLIPFYNFDTSEEFADWETELLEDNHKKDYRSLDCPTITTTELSN